MRFSLPLLSPSLLLSLPNIMGGPLLIGRILVFPFYFFGEMEGGGVGGGGALMYTKRLIFGILRYLSDLNFL